MFSKDDTCERLVLVHKTGSSLHSNRTCLQSLNLCGREIDWDFQDLRDYVVGGRVLVHLKILLHHPYLRFISLGTVCAHTLGLSPGLIILESLFLFLFEPRQLGFRALLSCLHPLFPVVLGLLDNALSLFFCCKQFGDETLGVFSGGNQLLDEELEDKERKGVVILPTTFVNTAAMRGQLSVKNIFTAICAGYSDGTTPLICDQCSGCSDTLQCITNGGKCTSGAHASATKGQISTHTFGFTIIFMAAAFAGVGYWHYNKTRDDMREQVRGILAEYMPLEDQDDGGNPMEIGMRQGNTPLFS